LLVVAHGGRGAALAARGGREGRSSSREPVRLSATTRTTTREPPLPLLAYRQCYHGQLRRTQGRTVSPPALAPPSLQPSLTSLPSSPSSPSSPPPRHPHPPNTATLSPSSSSRTTGPAYPSSPAAPQPAVRPLSPLSLSFETLTPHLAVTGALLGTQAGRDVEIFNSFELVVNTDDHGNLELDHAYFDTRRDQCPSPLSHSLPLPSNAPPG